MLFFYVHRANMSKIPAQNLPGTITKKKKEGKPSGNPQQSDKKEVCSKVKQFLLEEGKWKQIKNITTCVSLTWNLFVFRGQSLQEEGTLMCWPDDRRAGGKWTVYSNKLKTSAAFHSVSAQKEQIYWRWNQNITEIRAFLRVIKMNI